MSRPFFRRALCAAVLAGMLTCQAGAVGTSAVSAVLLEGESGRVLYAQNADEERLIASITKIMTAVVALEHGDVNAPYTVTAEDMAEGSSMYLTPGEELTLEELLYGLMLVSGNDAALAVAHCVAGDEASFVELMNETAARLGMTHTSFANPNGLDAEGHYSSAADMAKLAAYALKKEAFRRIVSTTSITIGERYLANHNKLLKLYDGCLGVKTGYTKAAGRTLVSAAERDGMTLVCVTLCDGDDWNDHVSLLDYGFSVCRMETAAPAGRILASVQVRCGSSAQVPLMADRELRYPLMGDERLTVVAETPVSVPAPVVPGQVIGTARAYLDGEEVASVPLVAAAPSARVEFQEENSIFERLFG
ncbi:MAG: D-alanyl-D-alanine carboxypeptidase [Oscillospiraceae bacterium]|nr:D-alanyl-D-alanine carboxypeptidase [Oscillospiraceae bacterium]MCI9678206.1 D-alanyl-D-alanine carboxypeptidase [Oscillospiraceae bacterium]